jgi:hypothetical protein
LPLIIAFLDHFFHVGVPLVAARALANPFSGLRPAVLAEEGSFSF